MDITPDQTNRQILDSDSLMKAIQIGNEVKKVCEEAVERVFKATLSPEMAQLAQSFAYGTVDYSERDKKREQEALDAAAAGTGPMPYERDWYQNGYDIQDLIEELENWGLDWHLVNDFYEVLTWALNSSEGQRALEQKDNPNNPRQCPLALLLDLREALSRYRYDLLVGHAEKLEWSHESIERLISRGDHL